MLFDFIGDFFKKLKVWAFIKEFLTGGTTDQLKEYGTYAVVIVQRLRDAANNPMVKFVTDVIPGDWDADLVAKVVPLVESALKKTLEGNECAQAGGTLVEQFACYSKVVTGKPLAEKTKNWTNVAFDIAVEIATALIGQPFNLNKLLILIPTIYVQLFGKKED